jgi:hypothetical protein
MSRTKFAHVNNHGEGETVWHVLIALGIGALLGVLVAVPYDQLIGLSGPTCTILRSVVSVAVLGGLNIGRLRDLVHRASETLERAPGSFLSKTLWEHELPFERL